MSGPLNPETGFFMEEQRMGQLWMKLLLGSVVLADLGFILAGIWVQLVQGRPFGNQPLSDGGLIAAIFFMLLVGGFLPLAVLRIKMVVSVGSGRILINYWPLTKKEIRLSEVASGEAIMYRPVRDYGGWGIRYSLFKKTWVYNVGGARGVLVTLTNGSKVLIGSERPEELAAAIRTGRG